MQNIDHQMTVVAKILSDYESGLYTGIETECRLIDLAAVLDPVTFMAEVPTRWVEAIRAYDNVKSPPATEDEAATVLRASAKKEQVFKALWAMHRYFYGGEK
jgi:hypothetical protein